MLSQLLVPLDGSAFAETALPYALSVSRRAGSRIELVSVEEDAGAFPDIEWVRAASEWTRDYLEDTARRIRASAGGEVTTALLPGRIWETLVRRGEELGVDLVVMATHGRGALSRAWLGSTADTFVRHTDRPVLLVTPSEHDVAPAPEQDVAFKHILVPLDGSDFGLAILKPVSELSRAFLAPVTLLRVVTYPAELASPYVPQSVQVDLDIVERARVAAVEATAALAAELTRSGIDARHEVVVEAHPATAILARASELNVSMIALATHGRGGLSRVVLGSTTDKVIRSAHRPVLVLKPRA
jgi:nucleotide-binding universal stress UspA family protein